MFIHAETLAEIYSELGRQLLLDKNVISPRGLATSELICPQIKINNPRSRLVYCKERKFSIVHAIVESLMLFSERDDVKYFSTFNQAMANFSDNGKNFHGCYGARIAKHFAFVVKKLIQDKNSRQAVLNIYDIKKEAGYKGKDVPCTTNLNFIIRDNKLNLIVNMRSNDAILGMPYDIFNFTMAQEIIANTLGIDVGFYIHNPISLHYYLKDRDKLEAIVKNAEAIEASTQQNILSWQTQGHEYTKLVDIFIKFKEEKERIKDADSIGYEYEAGAARLQELRTLLMCSINSGRQSYKELGIVKNEIIYQMGKDEIIGYVPYPDYAASFVKRW